MSPAAADWRTFKPDQRLLQLDVVELHAGVLVEGGVVRRQAVGGLEGAAGLLRVAVLQRGIARARVCSASVVRACCRLASSCR